MYTVRYSLNDAEWKALAGELERRAADLRAPLKSAGEYMLLEVDDRFVKEAGPEGDAWPALAESTRKRKRTSRKLQESGNKGGLRGSITYLASRSSLSHGSNKIYAAIQQLGGTADMPPGPADIPARPYLGYSKENVAHIRSLVKGHLEEAQD